MVARYGALFPRTAARWATFPESIQAQRVALWRARLSDLSWSMRCLDEALEQRDHPRAVTTKPPRELREATDPIPNQHIAPC